MAGGVALLEAARAAGVDRIVFSSTAAVYGVPDATPIPEDAPLRPINPYGESKRTFEGALGWYGRAYGLRSVSLRYFNVAGATATLGEVHRPETHLIPNVLAAAEGTADLTIFGDDYPTPDGTCLRDYIHVADLADAHLRAIEATARGDATDRRAAGLQPRERRRFLDPRGHLRGGGRGRGAHPGPCRAASSRRSSRPRRPLHTRRRGARLASRSSPAWSRWSGRPGRGAWRTRAATATSG